MPMFKVYYERRTSMACYLEIEADDAAAAANKAQEMLVDGDTPLIEMPETYRQETNELGEVEEVDVPEDEDVEGVAR